MEENFNNGFEVIDANEPTLTNTNEEKNEFDLSDIESELKNINVSYVNDDSNIVEPAIEESQKLFDNDTLFPTNIDEILKPSNEEINDNYNLNIDEILKPAAEETVNDNNYNLNIDEILKPTAEETVNDNNYNLNIDEILKPTAEETVNNDNYNLNIDEILKPSNEEINDNVVAVEPINNDIFEFVENEITTPVVDENAMFELPSEPVKPEDTNTMVEGDARFTFDENGVVTSIAGIDEPVETTVLYDDEEEEKNETAPTVDDFTKEIIDDINKNRVRINEEFARLNNILNLAKQSGIADSKYLQETFGKMEMFDEVNKRFAADVDDYIANLYSDDDDLDNNDKELANIVF